jgi:hypothetical protein
MMECNRCTAWFAGGEEPQKRGGSEGLDVHLGVSDSTMRTRIKGPNEKDMKWGRTLRLKEGKREDREETQDIGAYSVILRRHIRRLVGVLVR